MSSIQDRLNAMNPAGYPKQPELSAAAIKQNKKWVAEKRAENAAKKAQEPAPAAPKPVAKQTPSRPGFSPEVAPRSLPTQYSVTTESGSQPIGQRTGWTPPESEGERTPGQFPLPGARPTSAGPGLATRGYRDTLRRHVSQVATAHPDVVGTPAHSQLAEMHYLGGSEAVAGALKDVQSMRVAETVGRTSGNKRNGPTGVTEAARSASSQMTPQGIVRHEVHGEVPRPGQMSTWREAEFEGGPPASAAAAGAVVNEAHRNLLGSLHFNRPGEHGGGRKSVDELIAGGAAPEEEGKQYEPKYDNKGKLLNPRPFDYSGKRGKVGRGGETRAETVGGQRVRATGKRESTAVVGGETVEIPSKLRYENVGGGRRGRPDEAGTVGTTVETRQMTNAERNAMQTSGLKSDRIGEIFQALGEQVPEAMRPKPATSGVSKGKKEFAARAEADTRRKKVEESAKKKAAAKKKK